MCGDFTDTIVEVDINHLLFKVKLSFTHLVFRWHDRVQFVLACHFFNGAVSVTEMLIFKQKSHALIFLSWVRQERYTSVDELIVSVFVVFKCLPSDLFFAIDDSILVSMVVVEKFTILGINLQKLSKMETCL